MCGIFGYIGPQDPMPILLRGLERVEYRGYDSAGLAISNNGHINILKAEGKLERLKTLAGQTPLAGQFGIAHTRWATHGVPDTKNAHPHTSCHNNIALVHNGIIENYATLKTELVNNGHVFESDTDTEVAAHLIEAFYDGDLASTLSKVIHVIEGSFALVAIATGELRIVAARQDSPLYLGIGEQEFFLASDPASFVEHTINYIMLDNGEMADITPQGYAIKTFHNKPIPKDVQKLEMSLEQIEKGDYAHFMLKEIHEQPNSVQDTMRGRWDAAHQRVVLGGLRIEDGYFDEIAAAKLIACGTSLYAAHVGELWLEQFAGLESHAYQASAFRYNTRILSATDLVIAISQSGSTADTKAALQEAIQRPLPRANGTVQIGAKNMGIVNRVGSDIAHMTNRGVYLHAGPEIGVASTKAFTSQLAVLFQLAIALGQRRNNLSNDQAAKYMAMLHSVPRLIEQVLATEPLIKKVAEHIVVLEEDKRQQGGSLTSLYLGRGLNYPVALEGALKLKEISYIHAEGYDAAEMKHGPIALIDRHMPVVAIATQDSIYQKVMSNLQEVNARDGHIIAIATDGDTTIARYAKHTLYVPPHPQEITPFITVIPLQLLAYHIARLKGCNIDQPKNLAKSVTVE